MWKAWEHFKTITRHRHYVMAGCFKLGLIRQGLLHDLSKYSFSEFRVGAKYWNGGKESANTEERRATGLSTAWLHHKGRNKHHLEYWIDYKLGGEGKLYGMKMPIRYVVEMFVDRMCACKNYQGSDYREDAPLKYYEKGKDHTVLHPDTRKLLEKMLYMLASEGEAETFRYIRENILTRKGSEYGEGYEDFI